MYGYEFKKTVPTRRNERQQDLHKVCTCGVRFQTVSSLFCWRRLESPYKLKDFLLTWKNFIIQWLLVKRRQLAHKQQRVNLWGKYTASVRVLYEHGAFHVPLIIYFSPHWWCLTTYISIRGVLLSMWCSVIVSDFCLTLFVFSIRLSVPQWNILVMDATQEQWQMFALRHHNASVEFSSFGWKKVDFLTMTCLLTRKIMRLWKSITNTYKIVCFALLKRHLVEL